MQNHVEMCFKSYLSVDVVNTCVLCIWNAFIDSLPNPLRIWWKTHKKNKECIHQYGQISDYLFLGSKLTEKNTKIMADQLILLSMAPWLKHL